MAATCSFVDIAGIVRGAAEGQGLGNKFLANIREADAICQVVRAFDDPDVAHVEGKVDPTSDIETINTELILADLQTVDTRLSRLEREARMRPELRATLAATQQAREVLDSGRTISSAQAELDLEALHDLHLLTAKPFIYVFNVDDSELGDDAKRKELAELVAPAESIMLCAKIEAELIELDDAEAAEMLRELGQDESGLEQLVHVGFRHAGSADVPHGGTEGSPRLDDPDRRDRPGGGRCDPHRLPARFHQGRDRELRRPDGRGIDGCRPRRRQGAHGRQGLRHAGRRHRRVQIQRLTRLGRETSVAAVTRWSSASTCRDTAFDVVSPGFPGSSGFADRRSRACYIPAACTGGPSREERPCRKSLRLMR